MRRFYDLGLRYPGSREAAEELVAEAVALGYERVCLNVPVAGKEGLRQVRELVALDLGGTVLVGAELDVSESSRNALHGLIARAVKDADLVAVLGGDLAVNKFAVDSRGVDVLRAPYRGRRDSGIDKAVASSAAAKGIALEIGFADLLETRKGRIMLLSKMREMVELGSAFAAPLVLTSGAADPLDLRGPRDLAAFAECLGLAPEKALDIVSVMPHGIIQRAAARKDETVIGPGVRVVR